MPDPTRNTAADPSAEQPEASKPEAAKPESTEQLVSIEKPKTGGLARFRTSKSTSAKVETLLAALPHYKISDAKDFVRLHPDEENYWSEEYFFVTVPVQGQKDGVLHLISAELAEELPPGRVQRFRLALAAKPYNIFFLCHVPSQNLDNEWNRSNLEACETAKKSWLSAVSKKVEGKEGYHLGRTGAELRGEGPAFSEPDWPTESLERVVERTFAGRMILERTDPAWRRLVGFKQTMS